MNKIFTTLTLLAAALTASAQNFTVNTPDGKSYTDGDVINIGYEFDGECYNWLPDITVHVNKATSAITGASSFSVTASASTPGVVQFCGLSTSCNFIGAAPVTNSATFKAGQRFPLSIDIIDRYENLSAPIESKITITDGDETINLTVNFLDSEHAGVNSVTAAAGTLRFNGRTVNFAMESAAKLTIYNISGRPVVNRTLAGTGSLNLSAIPAGVYVYRCGSLTGKVLLH